MTCYETSEIGVIFKQQPFTWALDLLELAVSLLA